MAVIPEGGLIMLANGHTESSRRLIFDSSCLTKLTEFPQPMKFEKVFEQLKVRGYHTYFPAPLLLEVGLGVWPGRRPFEQVLYSLLIHAPGATIGADSIGDVAAKRMLSVEESSALLIPMKQEWMYARELILQLMKRYGIIDAGSYRTDAMVCACAVSLSASIVTDDSDFNKLTELITAGHKPDLISTQALFAALNSGNP